MFRREHRSYSVEHVTCDCTACLASRFIGLQLLMIDISERSPQAIDMGPRHEAGILDVPILQLAQVVARVANPEAAAAAMFEYWRGADQRLWEGYNLGIHAEVICDVPGFLAEPENGELADVLSDAELDMCERLLAGPLPGDHHIELDMQRGTYFAVRHPRPGDCVWDIGAHTGLFARYALSLGATVLCVEPEPRNFKLLQRRLRYAGSAARGFNFAMSDHVGQVKLNYGSSTGGHSLHLASGPVFETNAKTIDDLATFAREPTFIKIDAEGAEVDIVRGGMNTIRRHRPFLLIEADGTGTELGVLMDELGYDVRSAEKVCDPPRDARVDRGMWHCTPKEKTR